MDTTYVANLILWLQGSSVELVSLYLFLSSVFIILVLLRTLGLQGLYAYNIIATILANIQVLKASQFSLSPEPVALGTITFATIFLVSDIITEHYGKQAAQRSIWLSFSSQIIVTILMVLTLGHAPLPHDSVQSALEILFLPSPRLVLASLISFVISLFIDIQIFNAISNYTNHRHLWLRTSLSTLVGAFVDNIIFSMLAWVLLAPQPVSLQTLIFTYILGTYIARILIALVSTPVLYLSYWFKNKNEQI
ncbi:queuosine precursor transporter [Candidatus Odyssella thessalonicensis]|uniref:queuosine precursor transporter n=1 Tax=Candidatus Odyssella thessalonicensis TaxID=84647 RepID=UPI000225BEAB|nr:queuosine precursor transporter [Candidatus Odyssella thessalonicensis]